IQWKLAKVNIHVALGVVLLLFFVKITPAIASAAQAVVGFVVQLPALLNRVMDSVQWEKQYIAWFGTFAASIAIAGTASWIASGGLLALGGAIKGVFLAIGAGIKSIPVIGWVIAAIGLLVTALVWFFTQTELGQEIWAKVWGAIKVAAAAVWDWIKTVLWPGIVAAWEAISAAAVWMYENAIKPAWEGIKTAALAVWDWISGTLWPGMVAAWEAISGAAVWLYENGIKPAWDGIKGAIDAVWQWITQSLAPGISGVWDA